MPPTTTSEFGDVVLVPFPFTDQSTTKKRPAVVVSSADYNARRPDVIGHLRRLGGEDLAALDAVLRRLLFA